MISIHRILDIIALWFWFTFKAQTGKRFDILFKLLLDFLKIIPFFSSNFWFNKMSDNNKSSIKLRPFSF